MEHSPLLSAINAKDVVKIKELLAGGASITEKRSEFVTPLEDAIRLGCAEVVEVLLDHGADPNEPSGNPKGERSSPLILAAKKPSLPIVQILLARGVEIN